MTFNLLHAPWIAVLRTDGTADEVSLLDTFRQGRQIRRVTGELPTQAFAIHRLLLAILHRATPVETPTHWARLRDDPEGMLSDVEEYLRAFENRFDLFHPAQPFFQVADLRTARDDVGGLERIIADVPNGHQFLTTRAGAGVARITAAEAARWLVHVHAYDTSGIKSGTVGHPRAKNGKAYPEPVGWAGQLGGIEVLGSTLHETLLRNLVGTATSGVLVTHDPHTDLPPWERPTDDGEPLEPEPTGLVDLYTRQSRRVRLVGDREGVTGVVLTYGDRVTPQDRQRLEPMSQWRFSEPQSKKFGRDTYMPNEHRTDRAFWRGLAALLPQTDVGRSAGKEKKEHFRPAVLTWNDRLRLEGHVPEGGVVRVHAVGQVYGTQSAVVDELVDDTLDVPAALLDEAHHGLHATAISAVRAAEDAVYALRSLARNLAAASGDGEPDGAGERAAEALYAELDVPFREWLRSLAAEDVRAEVADVAALDAPEPVVAPLARWHREVLRLTERHRTALIAAAGPAAWTGRTVSGRHVDLGRAEVWFLAKLREALPHAHPAREEKTA